MKAKRRQNDCLKSNLINCNLKKQASIKRFSLTEFSSNTGTNFWRLIKKNKRFWVVTQNWIKISKVSRLLSSIEIKTTDSYLIEEQESMMRILRESLVIEIIVEKDLLTQLKIFRKFKWRKNSYNFLLKTKTDLTKKLNFCSKTNKRRSSKTIFKRRRNWTHKYFSHLRLKSSNKRKQDSKKNLNATSQSESLGSIKTFLKRLQRRTSSTRSRRKFFFRLQFN